MPKSVSATELRKMSASDLRKEIVTQRNEVAKMKLAVEARSQKDTAHFRSERRSLARLLTVLNQVEPTEGTPLKAKSKTSKVSASKSSTSSK
jgi:ribosomal protein L29